MATEVFPRATIISVSISIPSDNLFKNEYLHRSYAVVRTIWLTTLFDNLHFVFLVIVRQKSKHLREIIIILTVLGSHTG